ncbi:protein IQ-DOMAIN 32 [Euphorbia lathyris]|uniref:protein IQ-DOMAIN 32 n=1 Tax=Euphorbia lathyris TaxID=212925 RepID=UPI003313BA83
MGRSTSCFKLIPCAGDSTDNDDLQAPENKGSSDKRRWSFRKRSARHRVLSNTVIAEAPYSANKGCSDSGSLNFQSPDTSTVPEKISVIHCTDEKPQLPTSIDSKASETIVVIEDKSEDDAQLEESVVIVIQTAVRGSLAQRELSKLKNLVKLQAAVRGHLVRQQAIGTLRCVQAIVKMQTLVRARQARLFREGLSSEKKIDGKYEKANSKTSGKENSTTKPNVTYTSINKLLSNKFARQLMESTPKERPIHIKCDPAKPNSAWNWLERWMSVSSAEPTPHPESRSEQLERENTGNLALQEETAVPFGGFYEIADSESSTKENDVLPSLTDEKLISSDKDDFQFQEPHPPSALAEDNLEQPRFEKIVASDVEEPSTDIDSLPNQTTESNVEPHIETNSLPNKEEVEGEPTDQPKRKRYASEPLETEGKKFVFGSRKVSNPSFLAAHSKFEELSSTTNSTRSPNQDGEVEPKTETVSSGANTVMRTKELNVLDNAVPNTFRGHHGGSECGTELSVTSTLDSPDISEVGAAEPESEREVKSSEKETCNPSITKDDVAAEKASSDPVSDLSDSVTIQPDKHDDVRNESANSIVAAKSPLIEKKPERSASDIQRELSSETVGLTYRSSPEASPRSLMTVPESQGTPSSQLSVTDKKNRSGKSASNQKRKYVSATKRSPSNPNNDSGARDSMEQLARDQKNGKRRNSFGSTRADHTDQEPGDSSSSSSVPHFMQATQSAKAKLQATSSPRSSPDIQDREYVKKRHSLPGTNGRQGSPRIQRSTSLAQPGSKGNGALIVHEKKWQR